MIQSAVLHTHHYKNISALKIQPDARIVAAAGKRPPHSTVLLSDSLSYFGADESGSLLFFKLSLQAQDSDPYQERRLLPEFGGVSEVCWISSRILAVGTTRGKIVVFSAANEAVSPILQLSIFLIHNFWSL